MTDAQYREIAVAQTEAIEANSPTCWLVDTADLGFVVAPETQEWADTTMFPRIIAAGVKYIAFVLSSNIFSQISVEQLMEEKNVKTANFEIQNFGSVEDAENWLKSV